MDHFVCFKLTHQTNPALSTSYLPINLFMTRERAFEIEQKQGMTTEDSRILYTNAIKSTSNPFELSGYNVPGYSRQLSIQV